MEPEKLTSINNCVTHHYDDGNYVGMVDPEKDSTAFSKENEPAKGSPTDSRSSGLSTQILPIEIYSFGKPRGYAVYRWNDSDSRYGKTYTKADAIAADELMSRAGFSRVKDTVQISLNPMDPEQFPSINNSITHHYYDGDYLAKMDPGKGSTTFSNVIKSPEELSETNRDFTPSAAFPSTAE
ncbi:uncharacterized protein IL334_003835 [Kwoniella shivajii]|uniref:AP2/ERF domain-containing protein n=1 Tax=Kwoniella shivajii TaxID=564305 RepID=A0ABZ1CZX6_9TREE|nr:hypothetical protein IL334_003835 [Kwoniella shivajii]